MYIINSISIICKWQLLLTHFNNAIITLYHCTKKTLYTDSIPIIKLKNLTEFLFKICLYVFASDQSSISNFHEKFLSQGILLKNMSSSDQVKKRWSYFCLPPNSSKLDKSADTAQRYGNQIDIGSISSSLAFGSVYSR